MPSPPLSGILFDMGDIFYDATPWRRAVAAALVQRGVEIDFAEFVRCWEAALVPVYRGRKPYWDAFAELLAAFPLDASGRHEVAAVAREMAHQAEERTLFPGVADTLAELHRRGIKLGVLSDTESREPRVRQRLAALGIVDFFAAVVTSADIGYVKPMREAYAAALDRLGVEKQAAAFVGHDEEELAGAKAFGLATIAYNYAPGAPADYYLGQFSDLLALATALADG